MVLEALALMTAGIAPPAFVTEPYKELLKIYVTTRGAGSVTALVDLKVEPSGQIYDCTLISPLGDEDILATICPTLRKLKMTGATDIDGRPSYGVFRNLYSIETPNDPNPPPLMQTAPDYDLTVNRLPTSARDGILRIDLLCELGSDETVKRCEADPEARYPKPFVEVAKQQASGAALPVLTDRDGTPVPYVRKVSVAFTLEWRD